MSKRPGSVWNCLRGHVFKLSPGINRKSRALYHGPEFLSSTTWPSMPKKRSNGLIHHNHHIIDIFLFENVVNLLFQFTSEVYEKDLQQALLLSKLEFEQQKEVKFVEASTDRKRSGSERGCHD